MALQDNAGLMISRALQVARTEPCGPVYLTLPREVSLHKIKGAKFPTMDQLGVAKPAAPDMEGIREIARRLVKAENPFVLVARSGRNPATVPALVQLCELMALPVAQSGLRAYQCFPLNHPLYLSGTSLKEADVVLALDVDIPWHADSNPPPDSAWVAMTDVEPAKRRIPTMEFTADLRLTADALSVIEALTAEVRALITPDDQSRFNARAERCASASAKRRNDLAEDAKSRASKAPIDPKWLSYRIAKVLDDNCIVFDETISQNQLHDYLNIAQPGAYFHNPASSGGWATGAAFGAKLAAPDKDVIAVSGDGFYMFGTPVHALWAARHYKAPFMAVVYQNRSYSTGTLRINSVYGAKDSYAAKANYDGGYFDPPIDFAKEAEAAGAYGENVTDSAQIEGALRRGLKAMREEGRPAVISVWLARLLQKD
jgi:acetolactate synthase-1/2/3 large subunit